MKTKVNGAEVLRIEFVKSGEGKAGPWTLNEILIKDYNKEYNCKCFQDVAHIQPGDYIIADVRVESREYNGRYYYDLVLTNILKKNANNQTSNNTNNGGGNAPF